MDNFEYEDFDAVGLAELVRRGEVSPAEMVDAAIKRIEAWNPQLNAVIHKRYDDARREVAAGLPEGPFRGVPFLLKDLTSELSGCPVASGSRFLRGYVPDHDAEIVRRYRAAGLVVLGKTNTPEFGLMPTTEPLLYGPTRNPWSPDRSPGGSSGGSAAAVASGMVPAAHGGDGGGSIRIPASCCGLFGLKPTRGRTPTGPNRGPHWHGAAIEHVITRSVRDSAAILDAVSGTEAGAPYEAPPPERPFADEVEREPGRLRIAVCTTPFLSETVDAACVDATHQVADLLVSLGHDVVADAPTVDGEAFSRAFLSMVAAEVQADVVDAEQRIGRRARWSDLEPATWALALLGRTLSGGDVGRALRVLHRESRRVGRFFDKVDVLLTPTLASPPVRLGTLLPTQSEERMTRMLRALHAGRVLTAFDLVSRMAEKTFSYIPFTPVFNWTGQPAMSVPLSWTADNLPIGSQLVGRFGDEATLFRLAAQLETALPWANRRPPLD